MSPDLRVRPCSLTAGRIAASALVLLAAACTKPVGDPNVITGGNSDRGRVAIERYGCGSCHSIPGISDAKATVGPNLDGLAGRSYVAGVVTNSPENLMRWIRNPQAIDDKTAMPNLGVTPHDARDIAAYLYSLK